MDILPFKTCTLDCVYCQLGPSSRTTVRRRAFFDPKAVVRQVREAVASGGRIDHITFSGSGEPTLNRSLGEIIRGIKKFTRIPVVVLTNGTLLHRKDVRRDLREADVVVPDLDAATAGLFARVNRPDKALRLEPDARRPCGLSPRIQGADLARGHARRRAQRFAGPHPEAPEDHRRGRRRQGPSQHRRPPSGREDRPAAWRGPDEGHLQGARPDLRGRRGLPEKGPVQLRRGARGSILAMVRRRPVTAADIAASLGREPARIAEVLASLVAAGRLRSVPHGGKTYFEPC